MKIKFSNIVFTYAFLCVGIIIVIHKYIKRNIVHKKLVCGF